MRLRSTLPLLLLGLSLTGAASRQQSQLSFLRERLAAAKPYGPLNLQPALPIAPRDHLSSVELTIDGMSRAVLLIGPWDSVLLTFDAAGNLKAHLALPEVDSSQALDLDSDGIQEILLDQVDGHGSGIHLKRYHLYSMKGQSIRELWSGESFERSISYASGPKPKETLVIGLVKFQPAGAGIPGRLFHVIERRPQRKSGQSLERHVLIMKPQAQRLEEIPWPGE
jgi:hypothetical protein